MHLFFKDLMTFPRKESDFPMIYTAEKRKFDRYNHKEPVEILFKGRGVPAGSLSGDLSGGGVRVFINDFMPLNEEVALQVKLADGRVIECGARVVWIRKNRFNDSYQAGLEFTGDRSVVNVQRMISGYLQTHVS